LGTLNLDYKQNKPNNPAKRHYSQPAQSHRERKKASPTMRFHKRSVAGVSFAYPPHHTSLRIVKPRISPNTPAAAHLPSLLRLPPVSSPPHHAGRLVPPFPSAKPRQAPTSPAAPGHSPPRRIRCRPPVSSPPHRVGHRALLLPTAPVEHFLEPVELADRERGGCCNLPADAMPGDEVKIRVAKHNALLGQRLFWTAAYQKSELII
jgi:hypothetical protein